VHGEDDRNLGLDACDRGQENRQRSLVVHVARPVQGQGDVLPGRETEAAEDVRLAGQLPVAEQGVDHHVAHEVHLARRDALAGQVLVAGWLRGEEEVRDRVGQDAIDLLRHAPIEATQSRLHVRDRPPELHGGEARHRRVHVTHHQHHVGTDTLHDRLQAGHDVGDLGHRARGLLG
jgi:hypothetical protein